MVFSIGANVKQLGYEESCTLPPLLKQVTAEPSQSSQVNVTLGCRGVQYLH